MKRMIKSKSKPKMTIDKEEKKTLINMKNKIHNTLVPWISKKPKYLRINGKNIGLEIGEEMDYLRHMLPWKL